MADSSQNLKSDTIPEKTHGVTKLVITFRVALFVVYAGLAVTACVYTFAVQGSCMVRQTYTPVSMDSFSGSEMYNGMGIISRPPTSRVVDMTMTKKHIEKASDMAAFPVMASKATRDAAFLTVALGQDSGVGFIFGALEPPDLAFMESAENEKTLVRILNKMNAPGVSVDGGTVPNIGRCLHEGAIRDDEHLEQNLINAGMSSHNMGACMLSGQQRMVDVSSHPNASLAPFSSTNIIYICMVVLWLTASFAAFTLQSGLRQLIEDNHFRHAKIKRSSNVKDAWSNGKYSEVVENGLATVAPDFLLGLCVVWNVVLVGLSVAAIFNDRVPANNAIASLGLAVLTIIFHASSEDFRTAFQPWLDTFMEKSKKSTEKRDVVNQFAGIPPSMARHLTGGVTYLREQPYQLNMGAGVKKFANDIYYRPTHYVKKGTLGEVADESHLLFEYAITTPIFLASLLAAMSPSATTPIIVAAFGNTLAYYMVCQATLSYRRLADVSKVDISFKMLVSVILIIAQCVLGVMFIILMQFYDNTFQSSGRDVKMIYYFIMITHVLFIFVSAFIQIIWMAVSDPASSDKVKTGLNTTFYSVINMVQKLAISCIVIDIFYNGEFPQQACQLWVDI